MRTDEQIRKDIIEQLQWDSRINSTNINVEVNQHVVTLSGNVNSYMQKTAAQMDALSIAGVSEVHNHLKIISDTASQKYTDEQIVKNVKTVISLNPVLNPDTLEIRVEKGIVFLGGSVDEYWKKCRPKRLLSMSQESGMLSICYRLYPLVLLTTMRSQQIFYLHFREFPT